MTRVSPPVKDSDILWLAIKKLQAVAGKMERLEYDENLDQMMIEAAEWFDWAAFNINGRNGVDTVNGDPDEDPFERAAIIAETLMQGDEPASPAVIAAAIRAWSGKMNRPKSITKIAREALED